MSGRQRDSDAIVIGSGMSGACAAHRLVALGAHTRVLDVGVDDPVSRESIPDRAFHELRAEDEMQSHYLIGRNLEGVPRKGVVVGAQLTPPRQFLHRRSEELFPFEPGAFTPLIATSVGGLGAGWGAAAFAFSPGELAAIGIPADAMAGAYLRAAELIGISADPTSSVFPWFWPTTAPCQPPLEIDDNARNLLQRWSRVAPSLAALGAYAGRIPMAVLSRDCGSRRANPYFDMDFYGDSRKSVFRPRYVIEDLLPSPNFDYRRGMAVYRIESRPGERPRVHAINSDTGQSEMFTASRVLLCANALNSGRIILNSLPLEHRRTTVLCNPYTYFPTVNLGMLGLASGNKRHSLAQFGGVLLGDADDTVDGVFQMYSYRSLLLFKLVKEMPLPPTLGILVARTLATALSIFGIFFRDAMSTGKRMELLPDQPVHRPKIRFDYQLSASERAWKRSAEARFRSVLLKARCLPLSQVDPGPAGSIHYAGTIPFENPVNQRVRTLPDGTVADLPNVFVGDSSSWNTLPAKGLSFTLAANAIRVAELAANSK